MAKQELTYDDIMASLKARQFAPIYLLMGEEGYFTDEISNYIIDHILTNDEKEYLPDDYLFLIESKALSTPLGPNSADSVFNNGITDLQKDLYSRTAKTITYLITQYSRDKDLETAKKVRRFEDPVNNPYKRFFNAAIVVEAASAQRHIINITEDNLKFVQENSIGLFVVPIAKMKTV